MTETIEKESYWLPKENARHPDDTVLVHAVDDEKVTFYRLGSGREMSGPKVRFLEDFRPVDPAMDVAKERAGLFSFDEGNAVVGFHNGRSWNGWATPLIPKAAFEEWCEADSAWVEEAEYGGFKRHEGKMAYDHAFGEEDDIEVLDIRTVEFEGKSFECYDVGGLGLCWNVMNLEDPESWPEGWREEVDKIFILEGMALPKAVR